MGANVHRQRAPLDEALPATLLVASVRSLLGVDAMMSLQIRFAIEALQVNQPSSPLPPVQVQSTSEHERHSSKEGDLEALTFSHSDQGQENGRADWPLAGGSRSSMISRISIEVAVLSKRAVQILVRRSSKLREVVQIGNAGGV